MGRPRRTQVGEPVKPEEAAPTAGKCQEYVREATLANAIQLIYADGLKVREAAAAMGCDERTVYRLLASPDGKEARDKWMAQVAARGRIKLGRAVDGAIRTLVTVAKSGGREDGPRVKAAEAILDRAGVIMPKEPTKVELSTPDGLTVKVASMTEEELQAIIDGAKS